MIEDGGGVDGSIYGSVYWVNDGSLAFIILWMHGIRWTLLSIPLRTLPNRIANLSASSASSVL